MTLHEIQWKILRAVADIQEPPFIEGVADSQVSEMLELDLQEVRDHLDLMAEAGHVELAKTFGGYSAWLTPLGRVVLREPGYTQQRTPAQVVNILNVIDSQIQNLAQTGGQTVISQSVDAAFSDDVRAIIDEMVGVVNSSGNIGPEAKQDYTLEAEGLKAELGKSRLNLSRIREMLSFLGDIEGTMGLANRLAPYLLALAPYIERLIKR